MCIAVALPSLLLQDKFNSLVTAKHHKLYSDISDLKDTMVENIDKVLERGERIDLLVDKSENLNEMSFVFKKNAKRVKDDLWWKNTKLILMFSGVGLVGGQTERATGAVGRRSDAPQLLTLTHPGLDCAFRLSRSSFSIFSSPPGVVVRRGRCAEVDALARCTHDHQSTLSDAASPPLRSADSAPTRMNLAHARTRRSYASRLRWYALSLLRTPHRMRLSLRDSKQRRQSSPRARS